jgi:hypothetical protein
MLNIRHLLKELHTSGGAADVLAYLEEHARSCLAGRLNGWRTAAYEAWAASDWFCDGGFAAIG